ncbi:helix-turn-helix transcriptional regulator [Agarivorans sp. 3_MG-2023]|uniref:helix-turn-helix transcriptional regulator n=1 Tax=Agarivorans sp. 3_MG-2023 TaxID=3062648 RepID=UPI0026E2EDE3|nr:helix-turn-helix transcriptional regulator [Agarivorans sp. 3_MG-2023]MDO6687303.1 helix-turn-helix transcriptional regulator [Agarivorans sp. 3_MG-2023]
MPAHALSFENIHLPQGKPYYLRRFHIVDEPKMVIPTHFHMLGEIMLFKKIAGQVEIDGQAIELGRNVLVFIPSLGMHAIDMDGDDREFSLLQFERYLLSELNLLEFTSQLERPLVIQLDEQQAGFLHSQFEWLENADAKSEDRNLAYSLLHTIFLFLAQQHKGCLFNAEQSLVAARENKGLSKLIPLLHHLENQQTLNLNLQQAADICGMSKYHFSRLFKSLFDQNYKDYILKRKINTAVAMLSESRQSITQIAYACEFSDSAYFCAKFKQVMGMSPGKFRQSTQTVLSFN